TSVFYNYLLPFSSPISLFSTAPAPPETSTLSLHDALPILNRVSVAGLLRPQIQEHQFFSAYPAAVACHRQVVRVPGMFLPVAGKDRKSTRLNSSHVASSYAVFCLKKQIFRQEMNSAPCWLH